MNNSIIMHITYMEQGQSLSEVCARAVAIGFDGVEFRRQRNMDEKPEDYLGELASAVEKSGLKKILFGAPGPELMLEDSGEREREVEKYINFYELALKYFPMNEVNNTMTGDLLNETCSYSDYGKQGSFVATPEHYEWAAEGFKTIADFGLENGLSFAFETHMCYLHDSVESTKKLIEMIDKPNVGATFDYGNISCFSNPPSIEETIAMIGDKFTYFHLKNYMTVKNSATAKILCSLEDGVINNRAILKILQNRNYTGNIAIEAPRPGDREWFAKKDFNYIKEVMSELS